MQQSSSSRSAATTTGMPTPKDTDLVIQSHQETVDLHPPTLPSELPMPPVLQRSAEVVDLQDDYLSDDDEQPQVRSSQRLGYNPGSAHTAESFFPSRSAWQPNGLPDFRFSNRSELDRAYRALCNVPQVAPLTGLAYNPPWGVVQGSAIVPHDGPAYNPSWGAFQAPTLSGSQSMFHGLPNRNIFTQGPAARRAAPTAFPQTALAYDPPWSASQTISSAASRLPSPAPLKRSDIIQDSAVKEEAPSPDISEHPDGSVQPISLSPPEEAATPAGTDEQEYGSRSRAQKDPTKYEADQYHGNWRPLENVAGPLSAAYTDITGSGPKQVFATHNGQPGVFWVDVPAQKAVFLGQSAPDKPLRYTLIRITSYPHPTKMYLKLRLPPGVPAQRGAHALHQASEVGCWIKFRAAMQECTNLWDPEDKHTGQLVHRQWYYRIDEKQPELMDVVRQMVACTRIRPKKK
ncbi:hypothetical protein H2201_007580 [Coniosporium apollinis]|uniref:YTH domain-containing protein n=1 Tax=Coniosporium apollinis TaxID=61459 RepID=A0ABQ9NM86_9PEZI|nr:hypothetical protein H2201_007580 [Coniosporium apollinis]